MIQSVLCLIPYTYYINYISTNFPNFILSDNALFIGFILINGFAWLFIFLLLLIFKFVILFIGNNIL